MAFIANTEGKLQRLFNKSDKECRERGLKISINKSEVMGVTK